MKYYVVFDKKLLYSIFSYASNNIKYFDRYPEDKYISIQVYETELPINYFRLVPEEDETYTYRIDRDQYIADEWKKIREKRNKLLFETDHYFILDVKSKYLKGSLQELVDYREELRNLPEKFETPFDVVWPVFPTLEKNKKPKTPEL